MAILEVKSVCKSYGAGAARSGVLEGVSLSVEEGEFVAILGFSGSGKTTMINLMAGLIAPDSGEVLFRGHPSPRRGPSAASCSRAIRCSRGFRSRIMSRWRL